MRKIIKKILSKGVLITSILFIIPTIIAIIRIPFRLYSVVICTSVINFIYHWHDEKKYQTIDLLIAWLLIICNICRLYIT